MLKRYFIFFLFLIGLASCSFFENKKSLDNIPIIDTIVDFNSVDAFPLFPDCIDIPSREKQQICFQLEMSQHIYASLKAHALNSRDSINDTIFVKLKIDAIGKTSLSGIERSKQIKQIFPEFDSILKVSVTSLPCLEPAIKRNMPVTTEFTLPIIIKN